MRWEDIRRGVAMLQECFPARLCTIYVPYPYAYPKPGVLPSAAVHHLRAARAPLAAAARQAPPAAAQPGALTLTLALTLTPTLTLTLTCEFKIES